MNLFFVLTDCSNLGLAYPEKDKLISPENCNRYLNLEDLKNDLHNCWIKTEEGNHIVKFHNPPKKSYYVDIRTRRTESKLAVKTDLVLFDKYINELVNNLPLNILTPTKLTLNQDCCKVFIYRSDNPFIKLNYDDINKIFPSNT